VPFLALEGGDPFSARPEADTPPGEGGPGYGIPLETGGARPRLPFRGALGMCGAAPGTEGSTFFLLTGTALDLDGRFTIFGRVVEGQDALERLVAGDRLVRASVLRKRDGIEYHPLTADGDPAPDPRPTRR
jgi:cyclophilin family peptidyl-prolyl cis-trans isomerase